MLLVGTSRRLPLVSFKLPRLSNHPSPLTSPTVARPMLLTGCGLAGGCGFARTKLMFWAEAPRTHRSRQKIRLITEDSVLPARIPTLSCVKRWLRERKEATEESRKRQRD